MRIAVIGSGGVGGAFGAALAQAGADVTFVARGAHLEAMRANGLRVVGPRGDMHIHPCKATDNPAEIGVVDVVLFCVKLWDVESAGTAIKSLIGPNTAVIPLQNGIDAADRLIPILGRRCGDGRRGSDQRDHRSARRDPPDRHVHEDRVRRTGRTHERARSGVSIDVPESRIRRGAHRRDPDGAVGKVRAARGEQLGRVVDPAAVRQAARGCRCDGVVQRELRRGHRSGSCARRETAARSANAVCTRSTKATSRRRRSSRSWPARTGPTRRALSQSQSAPFWCSSCFPARTRRTSCSPSTQPTTVSRGSARLFGTRGRAMPGDVRPTAPR